MSLSSGTWRASVPLSVDWLSVNKPSSSTLKATYKRHTGSSPRSVRATVSVTGLSLSEEIVFTQGVTPNLTISSQDITISGAAASLTADAHTFDVSVSASSGGWSARATSNWLSLVRQENNILRIISQANLGAARTGQLIVSIPETDVSYTLTLSQLAPSLRIAEEQVLFDKVQSSTTLHISSTGESWTAFPKEAASWLSLTADVAKGELIVSATRNTDSEPRSARLVISLPNTSPSVSKELSVQQAANIIFRIDGSSHIALTASGGDTTLTILARDESTSTMLSDWTATKEANDAWITSAENLSSGTKLKVTYAANAGSVRSAALTLTLPAPANQSFKIRLTQAIPTLHMAYRAPTQASAGLSVVSTSSGYKAQMSPFFTGNLSFDVTHTGPSWTTNAAQLPSAFTYAAANDLKSFSLTAGTASQQTTFTFIITIPGSSLSRTLILTQESLPIFTLVPTTLPAFSAASGEQRLTLSLKNSSNRNFAWSLSSSNTVPAWLSLSKADASTLSVRVSKNSTVGARTASFSVVSAEASSITHTISVSQAVNQLTIVPSTSPILVDENMGSTTLRISTVIDSWTATNPDHADWLTLTPSNDKSTLKISYKANTEAARSTSIRIASDTQATINQILTLTQAAHQPYISPASATTTPFSPVGGSHTIPLSINASKIQAEVGTLTTWAYTVTENLSWLSSGLVRVTVSSNILQLSLSKNTSLSERTGTVRVTLSGHASIYATITITQRAAPTLSLTPDPGNEISVDYTSGELTYTLASSDANLQNFSATVSENPVLIASITNKVLTLNYQGNTTSAPRRASVDITVNGFSTNIPFLQAGKPTIQLAESSATVPYAAGSVRVTLSIEPANLAWTLNRANAADSWISSLQKINNEAVQISYTANDTPADRAAVININPAKSTYAFAAQSFTLTQKRKPVLTLSAKGTALASNAEIILDHMAGDTTLDVSVTPSTNMWSAVRKTVLGSWIKSLTPSENKAQLTISYYINTTPNIRKETILLSIDDTTVPAYELVLSQRARPELQLSTTSINLTASSKDTLLTVTANGGAWTATTEDAWIRPQKQTSPDKLLLSIDRNLSKRDREGLVTVSIAEASLTQNIELSQRRAMLTVSSSQVVYEKAGGTQSLRISSTGESWTATIKDSSIDWLTLTPNAEAGTLQIKAVAFTGAQRHATLLVSLPNVSDFTIEVDIVQTGDILFFAAPSSNITVGANAGDYEVRIQAQVGTSETQLNWSFAESPEVDWITKLVKDENQLRVSCTANVGGIRKTTLLVTLSAPYNLSLPITFRQDHPVLRPRHIQQSTEIATRLPVEEGWGWNVLVSSYFAGDLVFSSGARGGPWTHTLKNRSTAAFLPDSDTPVKLINAGERLRITLKQNPDHLERKATLELAMINTNLTPRIHITQKARPDFTFHTASTQSRENTHTIALGPTADAHALFDLITLTLRGVTSNDPLTYIDWILSPANNYPDWLEVSQINAPQFATSSLLTPKTLKATLQENTGSQDRSYTLSIQAKDDALVASQITVKQRFVTFLFSPTSLAVSAIADTEIIDVTSYVGAWTVSTEADWLTLTPNAAKTKLSIARTAHQGNGQPPYPTTPRTATLSFKKGGTVMDTYTVTQNPPGVIDVFFPEARYTHAIQVTKVPNKPWEYNIQITPEIDAIRMCIVQSSPTNLVIDNGYSDFLRTSAYDDYNEVPQHYLSWPYPKYSTSTWDLGREGFALNNNWISLSIAGSNDQILIRIEKTLPSVSLPGFKNINEVTFPPEGGTQDLTIDFSNNEGQAFDWFTWGASFQDEEWLQVVKISISTSVLRITCAPHTGTNSRSGEVSLGSSILESKTLVVKQLGRSVTLSASEATVFASADSKEIDVSSIGGPWRATTTANWLTLTPNAQNTKLNMICLANAAVVSRAATVAFSVSGTPLKTFTLTQAGRVADGLIPINTLEQLRAMRLDLNTDGQVPAGGMAAYAAAFPNVVYASGRYTGYELATNLDFQDNNSYSNHTRNKANFGGNSTGTGWTPIGPTNSAPFTGTFDGGGHTITNLYINRSTANGLGLFGWVNGAIRNVGIVGPNVTGGTNATVGGLAGNQGGGTIRACHVSGGKVTGGGRVGGLVGRQNNGTIRACYIFGGKVTGGTSANTGGLAGEQYLGTISTCYVSGATITGGITAGGLVGIQVSGSSTLSICYVSGAAITGVGEHTIVGSLVGVQRGTLITSYSWGADYTNLRGNSSGTITNSYFQIASGSTETAQGKHATTLRAPRGYTGIYANWNLDLDNADHDDDITTGGDNPWNFGADTQYPVLRINFDTNRSTTNDVARQLWHAGQR